MGAPRSSEGDRLTHRVQLPFEYDEGHETNNDEYGAEAQVGKEVAREITWARQREWDEDRAQASEEGPAPCKSNRATKGVPAGPRGQGQVGVGTSVHRRPTAAQSQARRARVCLLSTELHRS